MQHLTRRQLLRSAGVSAVALALAPRLTLAAEAKKTEEKKIGYTVPNLPYAFDALEPAIDARTMEIHHDRHHKAYVDNLNKAVAEQPQWQGMPIADLVRKINNVPESIRTAVRNNGGGHANHTMFWEMMGPKVKSGNQPAGEVAKLIDETFGAFEKFQEAFSKTAVGRFGSGWAWLVLSQGKLMIRDTVNQDCPLMDGQDPLLGIDVWEHAYYLKYQNKRADYVKAWWEAVNWDNVAERYKLANKG